ncbi:MAG: hypothetical protein MI743_17055, partial [Sneathiellales bacterium]|nr:hypothetical protein [Sneathiellales bacterium]
IIVERDAKPADTGPRKGVPQGHHIHVLLNRGEQILEELFPGFKDALLEKGSVTATLGEDVRWYLAGRWMPSFEGGMVSFFQSRPFLEELLRGFVAKIPNIRFLYETAIENLDIHKEQNKVSFLTLASKRDGKTHSLEADFYLDAMGRGSPLKQFLEAASRDLPPESVVGVDFAYASAFFEIPEEISPDWKVVLIYPKAPDETRAAAIVPVEGNRWLVTAAGYNGDHPPLDPEGYIEFMRSLSQPDVYDAIRSARLIDKIRPFKFKAGIRRHFEKSNPLPDNMLVIGDVICSANPFFGQGIAAAAQEAKILEKIFKNNGVVGVLENASVRDDYFSDIAGILNISWGLAIGEDLKYPSTTGQKPFGFTASRWVKDRIMSSDDPEVAKQFYNVMHFVDPPQSLFKPRVLKSVLLGSS